MTLAETLKAKTKEILDQEEFLKEEENKKYQAIRKQQLEQIPFVVKVLLEAKVASLDQTQLKTKRFEIDVSSERTLVAREAYEALKSLLLSEGFRILKAGSHYYRERETDDGAIGYPSHTVYYYEVTW